MNLLIYWSYIFMYMVPWLWAQQALYPLWCQLIFSRHESQNLINPEIWWNYIHEIDSRLTLFGLTYSKLLNTQQIEYFIAAIRKCLISFICVDAYNIFPISKKFLKHIVICLTLLTMALKINDVENLCLVLHWSIDKSNCCFESIIFKCIQERFAVWSIKFFQ